MNNQELVRCAYCRAERPVSEMKHGEIYFRNFKRLETKKNWYCADKPCHSYDQMSHEG